MDYSAANVALWNIIIQLGLIAGAILVANLLRRKVPFIRKTMMPVAVLGGFILLILKCLHVINLDAELLEMLVYHSIALGFIAMSLRVTKKDNSSGRWTGLRSGGIIVCSYLVQTVFGLLITLGLSYTLMPDMFKAAGMLLPMGYGQGPGQANNVGGTYEALGFTGGHSFALAIAAAGYLCACIVGVLMINVLARKGKLRLRAAVGEQEDLSVGFFQDKNELPVSDSIDRLSVQLALVLVVYLLTYLATWGLTSGIAALSPGLAATVNTLFWGFNFIIGSAVAILVRILLSKGRQMRLINHQYQNNYLLNRISGFFFDIMIVAGVAAINPENLQGLWLPFALLAVVGAIVTWLFLSWICKRVYPDYYYEGLISMYGMMTGTIGSGILLLRELDPGFVTPAANNLVSGSSFAIIFAAPILVLIGLAPKSDFLCWLTVGLVSIYFLLLAFVVCRLSREKKA